MISQNENDLIAQRREQLHAICVSRVVRLKIILNVIRSGR